MTSYFTSVSNISGLQLISTTTSNPPFSVNSSNLVPNLNAQYFNNLLPSYFTNANNISSGILAGFYGGTGTNIMTTGYLHFWSNSIMGQSSNLFWNNTSNYLGICTSNPASLLDINASSNISLSLRGLSTQQFIYPLSNGGKAEIGFCSQTTAASNIWWVGQGTGISLSNSFNLFSSIYGTVFTALSNGYCGINNSTPQAPLDIISPTSNTSNVIIRGGLYRQLQIVPGTTIGSNSASYQSSEITFNSYSDFSNLNYSATIGINTAQCGFSNFGFQVPGKGLTMTLQSNTGFVGIGTSNPVQQLDISGVNRAQGFINYYPILVTFYLTNNVNLTAASNSNLIPISNYWTYSSNNSSTPTSITSSNFINSNGFTFPYNGFYSINFMGRYNSSSPENANYFYTSNTYYMPSFQQGRICYHSTTSFGCDTSFTGYFSTSDYIQPSAYSCNANTFLSNSCGATYITIQLLIRCN